MEGIVRPFQTPVFTPPTVVPFSQPTKRNERVLVQIGQVGQGRTFRGSKSLETTVFVPSFDKHTYRIYEVIRVYDKDNPDGDDTLGYVDITWDLVSHFIDPLAHEHMIRYPAPADKDFQDWQTGQPLKWKIISEQIRDEHKGREDFLGTVW